MYLYNSDTHSFVFENAVLVDGSQSPSKAWADAATTLGLQLSKRYFDQLANIEQAAKQAQIDRLKQQLKELGVAQS
jgi:hypothetical protein